MNNLDTSTTKKNELARYDSSSGFTDPDSGCAKSEVSSSSENESKHCGMPSHINEQPFVSDNYSMQLDSDSNQGIK